MCTGVYDYPKRSELPGGDVAPDVDQVAYAIARNTGARIQPSEAVAASLLGLTDQVPARIVYLQLLAAITGSPQLNGGSGEEAQKVVGRLRF